MPPSMSTSAGHWHARTQGPHEQSLPDLRDRLRWPGEQIRPAIENQWTARTSSVDGRARARAADSTGAYSTDGATWITIGQAVVPQAAEFEDVGVFVTSHATALGRGVFDGLRAEG